jgi:type II secretory pathway component PulF
MKNISLFNSVSFRDKLFFTKHLSIMTRAGIPITEALYTLMSQTKSPYFKEILSHSIEEIKNGQSLAATFKKYPKIFDQFYISLLEVGEQSGTMEKNLSFLAKQLNKDFQLRQKIKGAMLYPGLVFGAASVMGGFIAFFILPQLVDFFDAFQIELPLTTRILLFFANTLKNHSPLLLGGIIGGLGLILAILRIPAVVPVWHRFLLKLPLFGKLIGYGQLSRFSRNLGILLQSGVPVTTSIQVTAKTLSNLKFKNDLVQVGQHLVKGKEIGNSLDNYSEYPPLVSKMISVGEKTGHLDETLIYLSDFYEEEIDNISKNLTTVLEPIMLLFIGLIVGFVALAIISPIYELTSSIRQ